MVSRRPSLAIGLAFVLVASLSIAIAGASPVSAEPVDLQLVIESIKEIDDPEDGFGEGFCWGDYEFEVTFDGSTSTSPEFSIDPPGIGGGCIIGRPTTINIGYTVSRTVETTTAPIDVSIKVTDIDTFNDDTIDVSPVAGQKVLRLQIVDPYLGSFRVVDAGGNPLPDDVVYPGAETAPTIEGDGDDDRGGLNLRIEPPGDGDADGDGLLDSWETSGFDADGDGTIDLDLPAWGADPDRMDLFVELDTANGRVLRRDDIQAMKNAFAAAPVSNPDGSSGITLWVDTGGAVDPASIEGAPLGTCGDGIDNGGDGAADGADRDCAVAFNAGGTFLDASIEDGGPPDCGNGVDDDGDGLADGADPDCLVGDDLGGGNAITTNPAICNLNTAFYTAKAANFDAERAPVFRYGISTPGTTGCGSGGQAEIGGNDFTDHNGDGGTIMHELGHTLDLRHGGDENDNCKPNHVSVMNYFNQFGIGRVGGGVIIDYAPVRRGVTGGPRSTALVTSTLDEAALSETTPLDGTDGENRFVFTNGLGTAGWAPIDGQTDWNGVGGIEAGAIDPVNVDTSDSTTGNPSNCTNTSTTDVHDGADEWDIVSVPFRHFGDSADAAINPTPDDEPTLEDLEELVDGITEADLQVTVADDPDPVAAGTSVSLTATVSNDGPATADATQVRFSADLRLGAGAVPSGCVSQAGDVVCSLGSVGAGESVDVTVPYDVPASLVHDAGGPTTVDTVVSVSTSGNDPVALNDSETEQTLVIAVADLSIDAVQITDTPLLLVVGEVSEFAVQAEVSNGGPSSPMDASVTFSAAGAGISVTDGLEEAPALSVGGPQTIDGEVGIECTTPGLRTITFSAAVAPADADDTDPNPGNDTLDATAVTIDCAVPVTIDVNPGDPADQLPVSSSGNVFVGVFTTEAGEYDLPIAFDATSIVAESVRLGRAADVQSGAGVSPRFTDLKDLRELPPSERRRDGDVDQRLRFLRSDVPLDVGDTEVCVIGTFVDATAGPLTFYGCTNVTVATLGGS